MKMKWQLLILICLSTIVCFGQGINNQWIFGYDSIYMVTTGRTTLDFYSGQPQLSWKMRAMNFGRTNVSICDNNGNLLFYTNGVYIANSLDDTMLNGGGLNPSTYTTNYSYHGLAIGQADIIIPFPSDSNKYYLFHETVDTAGFIPLYLYFTIIEMTIDGGLGGVVSKNNVLLNDSLISGSITGCKHANGRDWWIICHQYDSNRYYKFLISPLGLSGPFIQDIGKIMTNYGAGQMVFSPNGKKFAAYDTEYDLDLMDFDRCSGDFNNCIHISINDSAVAAGAAFSSNSNILYLTSTKYIYQFDLIASNVPSTQTTVAVWDGFYSPLPLYSTTFYLAQIANDNKIYISTGNGTDYLHVINFPDSVGVSCDICQHCIHLFGYNATTMPNFPNYFLGAEGGTICDSLPTKIPNELTSNNFSFEVFPNPVRDKLYIIQSFQEKIKSIEIVNSLGKNLGFTYSSIKNGEYFEVNTSSFSTGIYFLEILTEKRKLVKRFIKE